MEEEMKRQRAHSRVLLKKVPGGCHMPLLPTFHWLEFSHMTHGAAMEAGKCSFSLDYLLSYKFYYCGRRKDNQHRPMTQEVVGGGYWRGFLRKVAPDVS